MSWGSGNEKAEKENDSQETPGFGRWVIVKHEVEGGMQDDSQACDLGNVGVQRMAC